MAACPLGPGTTLARIPPLPGLLHRPLARGLPGTRGARGVFVASDRDQRAGSQADGSADHREGDLSDHAEDRGSLPA